MIKIDFDNINDDLVYEAFGVEGKESDALNDSYLELFELIGKDAMLKLFKHFRGDKIDCPMRLYRPEFIADLAKTIADVFCQVKIPEMSVRIPSFCTGNFPVLSGMGRADQETATFCRINACSIR